MRGEFCDKRTFCNVCVLSDVFGGFVMCTSWPFDDIASEGFAFEWSVLEVMCLWARNGNLSGLFLLWLLGYFDRSMVSWRV
jgi:hypothetical protein